MINLFKDNIILIYMELNSDYNCERCGYTTVFFSNLKAHFKRKRPCPPILNNIDVSTLYSDYFSNRENRQYICEYCERSYSTIESKCNHTKKCMKKLESELLQKQKLEELCEIVEHQQKQIEELKAKPSINNQTNTNNTNNSHNKQINNNNKQINNITINAFGKEDISYLIDSPDYKKFMIECLKEREQGIMKLMDQMYYNDSHPENHNIKKTNKKDKFMKAYDGTKWTLILASDGLNKILTRINHEFLAFLEMMEDNDERIKDPIMKRFMIKVGHALNYDFSIFDYDYDTTCSEAELKKARVELEALYLFYINEKTKDQFQQKLELLKQENQASQENQESKQEKKVINSKISEEQDDESDYFHF